jgi:hypothetical protein
MIYRDVGIAAMRLAFDQHSWIDTDAAFYILNDTFISKSKLLTLAHSIKSDGISKISGVYSNIICWY